MPRFCHCAGKIREEALWCRHCGEWLSTGRDALSPEGEAEVRSLLAEGEKIQAIKRIRDATGLGLAESKAVSERMMGISPTRSGCVALPAFLLLAAWGVMAALSFCRSG